MSTMSFRISLALVAGGLFGMAAEAAAGNDCRGTAREVCLLDGRFQANVTLRGEEPAWAIAGEDETGLFSATDQGEAAVSVRVIDGRAVNGYYWLLYNALTDEEVSIEIVDRVTGNRRRFVKEAGAPASVTVREALSASAQVVGVTLDTARAVTQAISTAGGSITVLDAQGTKFQVAFPADALNLETDITVTPVTGIAGLPFAGGLHGAVHIEPEGILPARTVRLTITPKPAVLAAQQVTFAFRGLEGEFFLTSPLVTAKTLVVPIHRLGGYGLGAGTAAELAAQLLRLPTREEDRLNQSLAGLLLPVRRAGKKTVPSSVEPLLLEEFKARIKPILGEVAKGDVEKYYPKLKNWSLATVDTGFVKEIEKAGGKPSAKSAAAQERAARLKGLRLALDSGLKACIADKNLRAIGQAFVAFRELEREKALKAGDAEKIRRCASFEVQWVTRIFDQGEVIKWGGAAETDVQLSYIGGKFFGKKVLNQVPIFTWLDCATKKLGETPTITLAVDRLNFKFFNFRDPVDPAVPQLPEIYYSFEPRVPVPQRWLLTCEDFGFGDPPIEFLYDWRVLYNLRHVEEISGNLWRAVLLPRPGDQAVFEATYQGPAVDDITEDTSLILLHTPK